MKTEQVRLRACPQEAQVNNHLGTRAVLEGEQSSIFQSYKGFLTSA